MACSSNFSASKNSDRRSPRGNPRSRKKNIRQYMVKLVMLGLVPNLSNVCFPSLLFFKAGICGSRLPVLDPLAVWDRSGG